MPGGLERAGLTLRCRLSVRLLVCMSACVCLCVCVFLSLPPKPSRCNKGEAQALSVLPHIEALAARRKLIIWPWVSE